MAPSHVSFHPEAVHEIEEARSWYLERSLTAEAGFVDDLVHAVAQVSAAPLRWPRHKADTRRYIFRRYPYSLIYRVYRDLVRVLAVAQDRRRAGYWIARIDEP